MANFQNAEPQNDFSELIPAGTLSWAVINLRPFNLTMGEIETPSKSSEARFLDIELVLEGGDYDRRKLWTRIGVAGSEKYINMGRSAIKAILEVGRGAGPQNPTGYDIPEYAAGKVDWRYLHGLKVAVKIKIDKGTAQYPDDKNEIATWLSPIEDSGTAKDFQRLLDGDTKPKSHQTGIPAAAAGPAWAGGVQGAPAHATPPAAPPATPPAPAQAPGPAVAVPPGAPGGGPAAAGPTGPGGGLPKPAWMG